MRFLFTSLFVVANLVPLAFAAPVSLDPQHMGENIGAGAFAKVYRVREGSRPLAVKVFTTPIIDDSEMSPDSESMYTSDYYGAPTKEMVDREETILRELGEFERSGTTPDGKHYIAMKYHRGHHIDWYIKNHILETKGQLELFENALKDTLQDLHSHRIVHNDIHDNNVLFWVGDKVEAHLIDFGMGKILEPEDEIEAYSLLDDIKAENLISRAGNLISSHAKAA